MAAITARTPRATPGRPYGDFSGKQQANILFPGGVTLASLGIGGVSLSRLGVGRTSFSRLGVGGAAFRSRTSRDQS